MIEFAVRVLGEDENKGWWVLAVDPVGERLLISNGERKLHWVSVADCILVKAIDPEQPRSVIAVRPQTVFDPALLKVGIGEH